MPAVKITNKPVSTPGDQTHFLVTQPELPEGYTPTGQETEEELAELKVESLREIEVDAMAALLQEKMEYDEEPTDGSDALLKSGTVKSELDRIDDDISSLNEDITNLQTNKQDALTFDSAPTAESTNPVTSVGIKNAIEAAVGDLSGDVGKMTSATSLDVGKALKAKTVENGKVTEWEFGEVGGADPAVIAQTVEDWLDEHPEAVTTVDFSIASKVFDTVADMVADLSLKDGDNVCTKGYYTPGDGGATNYVISSSPSGTFYIPLENGLYANRLSEDKYIHSDTIGIKHYASKSSAEADALSMETNTTIAQNAINSGFSIIFGVGWYAFDDNLLMKPGSDIIGVKRELTHLTFPNGYGLYFNTEQEWDYLRIENFMLSSLDDCIKISATVRNIINAKFDNLWLESVNGECIVAPVNNQGSRSDDTCVWSCYFGHINGNSENGAIFANIAGLGNWFYYINVLGNTHIAFRNCSGVVERLDTLTSRPNYCFYYDEMKNYSLALTLIDVHFEGCNKSFIYTEDETAATMAIGIVAIDSGVSNLDPYVQNPLETPMIKVGALRYLYHWGAYTLVPSETYFDMEALHGAIIHVSGFVKTQYEGFKTNLGGTSGLKIWAQTGQLYTFYSDYSNRRYGSGSYENVPIHEAMGINRMYGGRSHQQLIITDDMLPSNPLAIQLKDLNASYVFCDAVIFDLTSDTETLTLKKIQTGDTYPGKIFTIINKATSTKDIVLKPYSITGDSTQFCLVSNSDITLTPGKSIVLCLDYHRSYLRWYPIRTETSQYTLPDASSSVKGGVMIEDTPTENSTKAITSGGVYTALTNINSLSIYICTNEEYDAVTGLPTIQMPDESTFYLVPNGNQSGNDLFTEWIYRNGAWERFGSAQINLTNYLQRSDVDVVPTANSTNPVSSGGVKTALDGKQDTLTFDTAPTIDSVNPVTSGGVLAALESLSAQLVKIDSNGYFYVD